MSAGAKRHATRDLSLLTSELPEDHQGGSDSDFPVRYRNGGYGLRSSKKLRPSKFDGYEVQMPKRGTRAAEPPPSVMPAAQVPGVIPELDLVSSPVVGRSVVDGVAPFSMAFLGLTDLLQRQPGSPRLGVTALEFESLFDLDFPGFDSDVSTGGSREAHVLSPSSDSSGASGVVHPFASVAGVAGSPVSAPRQSAESSNVLEAPSQ